MVTGCKEGEAERRGGQEQKERVLVDLTYHFRWDAHGIKLFLVVGTRFGAVVRDEDDLFALKNTRRWHP